MTAVELTVLVLATFRVTRLLIDDTIFDAPRGWLFNRGVRRAPGRFLVDLFSCPWCLSVWVSAAIVAVTAWLDAALVPDVWSGVLLWLAIAAGAAVVYRIVDSLPEEEL